MKSYKICIVGLGYVGLPLAIEFGKKFYTVGYDISLQRIENLKKGIDTSLEFSKQYIKSAKNLLITSEINDLKNCNFFIITVPTPIFKNKKPDLSYLISATKTVSNYITKGSIVVYESTVYPGLTEEICIPLIEKNTKLKRNIDFFYGYSPERINPGDHKHQLTSIKKVISGSNLSTIKKIKFVYGRIIKAGLFEAKNVKVAEAAKVIENIQRDINVAFINELQIIFDKMNIDIYDVLEAAETKWNFLTFKPGLVGGHCIGIDPYYLLSKSKQVGYNPKLITAGRNLNDGMADYYSKKIFKLGLKLKIKSKKKLKILIMGFTFKENCSDIRNSKVVDMYNYFKLKKCMVDIFDPWVQNIPKNYNFIKVPYAQKYDIIIIAVKHETFKKLGLKKIKSFGNKKAFNE